MPSRRPGPIPLRLSPADRAVLESAARRAGSPLSTWIRDQALAAAVQGGIMIPPEVAHVIRQQARERGIDEVTLAALIAQAALGWPRR